MGNEVEEPARGCPTCGADLVCCPECKTRYDDGSGYCGTCDTFTGPSDLGLQRAAARASTTSPLTPEQAAVKAGKLFDQWLEDSGLSGWLNPDFGGWKTLIDRIDSELMAVATPSSPSVGEDVASLAEQWEIRARELQRKSTLPENHKIADIQQGAADALWACAGDLHRATPSTSTQSTARKVAKKIAEMMGFDVDVRLDANGTRVQDIIAAGLATPSIETGEACGVCKFHLESGRATREASVHCPRHAPEPEEENSGTKPKGV